MPSIHDDSFSTAAAASSWVSDRDSIDGGVVGAVSAGAAAASLVAVLEIGLLLRLGRLQLMEAVRGVRGVRVLSAEARCRHRRQIIVVWIVPARRLVSRRNYCGRGGQLKVARKLTGRVRGCYC